MRVSTTQFFQRSSSNMSKLQSSLSDQTQYLSSGKKILTAKDAPTINNNLLGFKEELRALDKYNANMIQAENKNNRLEVALQSGQNVLMQVKDTILQANNGAYDQEDLKAMANELRSNLAELLDIANSKNEAGDYIFSGYQVDQRPFSESASNSVNYAGDNGQALLQIAQEIRVPTSRNGEDIFLKVDNAVGDFAASYTLNPTPPVAGERSEGVYVETAKITDRQLYNASGIQQPLTFDFTDTDNDGISEITVTDNMGTTVVAATPYTQGQAITLGGNPGYMEVKLDGNPLPGDQFVLSKKENESMFDTLNNAINWIDKIAFDTSTPEKGLQSQTDYNHILSQITGSFNHLTNKRAEVGITLKNIDTQLSIALDTNVLLQSARGKIEDLDFASAISHFEQSKMSLQAAQQTFSQIQGLSLFNYI